jgi:hypothetical protein
VIAPTKTPGTFKTCHITRRFHNTNDCRITFGIGTHGAHLTIGEVEALATGSHALGYYLKCIREGDGMVAIAGKEKVSNPFGTLGPDSGEFC